MNTGNRTVWRDGEFVPWADATVHILAQSLQRGSLAFDFMSVHQARKGVAIFRLQDHVERLFKTCSIMGLPIAYSSTDLVHGCAETVRRNPGATSLKISALIPSIEADLVPRDPRVGVFICAYDIETDIFGAEAPSGSSGDAISLKVERDITNRRPDIIPPQAKMAANYTSAMFAKWRARRQGFDEIVLLDTNATIAEAPTSNIFVVADGGLATPPEHKVLHGITRASIIELAGALGMVCGARDLAVADLQAAGEVFLTSTSVGIRPVVRVDRESVADGAIGPVTARLQESLAEITQGANSEFEHWLHYV